LLCIFRKTSFHHHILNEEYFGHENNNEFIYWINQ
jgi:hypothetical protein